MGKRCIALMCIAVFAVNTITAEISYGAGKGWLRNREGEKTAYILSNGRRATGHRIISGRGYFFNEKGRLVTGYSKSGEKLYYIRNTKGMSSDAGWISRSGKRTFYTTGYGRLVTGRYTVKGKPHFFCKNGKPAGKGWIRDSGGGKLYYSTGTGKLATGIKDIGGKTFLFSREGKILKGKREVKGYPYYFKDRKGMGPERKWYSLENGKKVYAAGYGCLLTGVNIINGEIFGFGSDGYLLTGKQKIDGKLYYFDRKGKAAPEGWIMDKEGNPLYYVKENGRLATGKYRTGGREYHFDRRGIPYGYRVNADGKNYFYHTDGSPYKRGWVRNDDQRGYMYCSGNGLLLTGYRIINDRAFYFDKTGDMKFGKRKVNGKPYYFSRKRRGEPGTPGWTHFKSGYSVYSEGYGKLVTGDYRIGKKLHHFEDDGYIKLKRKGIDVSTFQGKINWKEVKKDGIEFAFIRTGGRFGEGGKIYDDGRYDYNMKNAIANGIDTGVYFFTQAVTTKEAVEEARYTCKKLKKYDVKYPVVIDTEYLEGCRHSRISVKQRTAVVKAFCDEVKRQGYEPMIYASLYWFKDALDMSRLKNYRIWVAQYYDKCQYEGDYNCWQYTDKGSVRGISEKVDRNIWYQ